LGTKLFLELDFYKGAFWLCWGRGRGDLDADEMVEGNHVSWVKIRNRVDDFCWEVINVYGPVRKEFKASFLEELYQKIQSNFGPLMVGVTLI
jgi:hypothetical protein